MAQLTTQDDYVKTALRLPKELHSAIQELATVANRSMNAEIIARLERSLVTESVSLKEDPLEMLRAMSICFMLAADPNTEPHDKKILMDQLKGFVEKLNNGKEK